MALPQTAMKTVFRNKKVISWESEPHYTAFGESRIKMPEIHAPLWLHQTWAVFSVCSSTYSIKSPG